MKELSIEQKAKAYDEALRLARDYYKANLKLDNVDENLVLEDIFPQLKEPDDEKLREQVVYAINQLHVCECTKTKLLAWLEKQGEQKPDYCHHEVDLSNCSEEYRKAYYDGWNNCNIQHSQCQSESNDVVKCLINGMKFYYEDNKEATWGTAKFSMKVKDILSWLEKQGNTDETINRDEFAQGVLRGAAINLITWIDYNSAEGNMCLSNMECKEIEDALVHADWGRIYAYLKKKLENEQD